MFKDLRFALLLIIKERWYSAVAVIALALGIGLNATVFTLVNAVMLRAPRGIDGLSRKRFCGAHAVLPWAASWAA